MKDWTDIKTQNQQKDRPKKRLETFESETARFQISDLPVISLEIIRLLLSGLLTMLGLTRQERDIERERALRVRRAVTEANRHVDTLWNNKNVYESWSGCTGPHWGVHMIRCWNYRREQSRYRDDPHRAVIRENGAKIRSQKNNSHPEADTSKDVSGTRRTGIMGAGPSRRGCATPQGEGILVVAPP